jgi:hypothetical protein
MQCGFCSARSPSHRGLQPPVASATAVRGITEVQEVWHCMHAHASIELSRLSTMRTWFHSQPGWDAAQSVDLTRSFGETAVTDPVFHFSLSIMKSSLIATVSPRATVSPMQHCCISTVSPMPYMCCVRTTLGASFSTLRRSRAAALVAASRFHSFASRYARAYPCAIAPGYLCW